MRHISICNSHLLQLWLKECVPLSLLKLLLFTLCRTLSLTVVIVTLFCGPPGCHCTGIPTPLLVTMGTHISDQTVNGLQHGGVVLNDCVDILKYVNQNTW